MKLDELIYESGVVGAGGAGFPTHVKANSNVEFVLANGAECEPLIHKDFELMVNFPEEIVDGMQLMLKATGAGKGYFGIKAKNARAIENISRYLPGTGIELTSLGDFYPSGDEYELVYEATKRLIPPGGIPLNVGCVVNNVETFYNVHRASKGLPVTDKFLSVTGYVKNPSSFFAPIGTSFRDLLAHAGGATIKDYAIFVSGLMMGKLIFDLEESVTKTTAGIIILPKDHYMVTRMSRPQKSMNRIGKSACDQCSYCTELCPRYLLGYDVQPHKVMRSLGFTAQGEDLWNQYADLCCSCGICTLYACPEELYPREACDQGKINNRERGLKFEQTKPLKVHPMKDGRRLPLKQLMKKIKVDTIEQPTPYITGSPKPGVVKIELKQHVGKIAEPLVSLGDKVNKGDKIAGVPEGNLGSTIHSSIDGIISDINEKCIIVTSTEN